MDADKPIIVIKKKGGHGGHHGGAWKIAYADFVTAMMAFFLVMWLVNSASTPTKENIASYFKRPGLFQEGSGTPLEIGGSGILDDAYVPSSPEELKNEVGESQSPRQKGFEEGELPLSKEILGQKSVIVPPTPKPARHTEDAEGMIVEELMPFDQTPAANLTPAPTSPPAAPTAGAGPGATPGPEGTPPAEPQTPQEMAEVVEEAIKSAPELESILGAVDISPDADSLNIEIMDTEKASMFASGSAYVREDAREAFAVIAGALSRVKNKIEVIGHTDSKPFSSRRGGYSNWELSVDRANAARRLLIGDGVEPARITGVQGKADTELKNKADPLAASNRRITIRMKFDVKKPPAQLTPPPKPGNGKNTTPATAGKKQQPASASDEEDDVEAPQPLERVHTLTPGQVLDNMQRNRESGNKASSGWKDPKFPGDK